LLVPMFVFRRFATGVYRFGPPAWFGLAPASKAQVVGGARDLSCYHAGGSNAKNSFADDPPEGFWELRTNAGSGGETGLAGESIAQNKANLRDRQTASGRRDQELHGVILRNKANLGKKKTRALAPSARTPSGVTTSVACRAKQSQFQGTGRRDQAEGIRQKRSGRRDQELRGVILRNEAKPGRDGIFGRESASRAGRSTGRRLYETKPIDGQPQRR
jgi:hypothetical protein